MAGTVSSRVVVIGQDSGFLDQLTDVVITTATHDQSLKYDSTNWVNTSISLNDLGNLSVSGASHDDVLIWDSVVNTWKNSRISDLLEGLEGIVNGIVSVKISVFVGSAGDPAKSLCVAFTDEPENGFTMSMCSCGDNNAIYKKGPSDVGFDYFTTLNRGVVLNTDLVAGTVFKSDKGISGFSGPFPMPFGISCLADTYFRFYALRNDNYVHATSAGRDSLVTLYASDETTIVDGPTFVSSYGSALLTCNANAEFVVTATTEVFCGTRGFNTNNGLNIDMRLVPPMDVEVIVHNRNNRISAQLTDTTVTWYRQNMTSGTLTVNAGTPVSTTGVAGSDTDYAPQGWLIMRANKKICGFSGADGSGWESTPGFPLSALSQFFPIVSTIGTSTAYRRASISMAGPYEGTCNIYDDSGTLLGSFYLVRGTSPPVTIEDQKFPAAGQWNPQIELGASITGGYVESNVPCVCIQNLEGSSIWGDAGDELLVPGTTPDDIRATIRKDPNGFLRRRDIDGSGAEVWTIC